MHFQKSHLNYLEKKTKDKGVSNMSSFTGTKINPKRFHRSQLKFYLYLIPLAIFMVSPIVYIIFHAFKPFDELFAYPPRFYVQTLSFQNFIEFLNETSRTRILITRYLVKSLVVTVSVILLAIVFSPTAAYALSKRTLRGKKLIFEINTLARMFVPAAVFIPRY